MFVSVLGKIAGAAIAAVLAFAILSAVLNADDALSQDYLAPIVKADRSLVPV